MCDISANVLNVLDIDLDAFLDSIAHNKKGGAGWIIGITSPGRKKGYEIS
jgi:hypothetical protein